jgi:glycosyltransferase involved in cell wall biosynthesis
MIEENTILYIISQEPKISWPRLEILKELVKKQGWNFVILNLDKLSQTKRGNFLKWYSKPNPLLALTLSFLNECVLFPLHLIRLGIALKRLRHHGVVMTNGLKPTLFLVALKKIRILKLLLIRDWNDLIADMIAYSYKQKIIRFFLRLIEFVDKNLLLRGVDGVIVLSEYAKNMVSRTRLIDHTHIQILHELVRVNPKRLSLNKSLRLNSLKHDPTYNLVISGIIRPYHSEAILQVIRAIHLTKKTGINFRLFILGMFEDYRDYYEARNLASKLNVELHVSGWIEHQKLLEGLSKMHISLVILPNAEFSKFITTVKLSETLAEGLPIIHTNLPGLREIVGYAGISIRSVHATDIADAMLNIAKNYNHYLDLAEKRALQMFSQNSLIVEVKSLLSWLNMIRGKSVN